MKPLFLLTTLLLAQTIRAEVVAPLEQTFANPTRESSVADSQIGVFWFWANTVTKEGIHRDLEEMQRAGIRCIAGALCSRPIAPLGKPFLVAALPLVARNLSLC
jgi:hypothetical protein